MRKYSNDILDATLGLKRLDYFTRLAWLQVEQSVDLLWNWHLDLICEYLEAVYYGEIKRLVINIPPRYGKSNFISVIFPTWVWLKAPWEKFVYTSYNANLSTKHSIARRRLMQSPWFQKYYGDTFKFTSDENVQKEFSNNQGGRMLATSVEGGVTGKGGNYLVMDDPHNPKEAESDVQRQSVIDSLKSTFLYTRLDDKKKGRIVCVMQRVHEKDMSSVLLDMGYEHLCLQAQAEKKTIITYPRTKKIKVRAEGDILHPEREGQKELDEAKKSLGPLNYPAQYQQEPASSEGNLFKWKYWNFYTALPPGHPSNLQWFQTWDLALKDNKKADYVAGQVWARLGPKLYFITGVLDHMDVLKVVETVESYSYMYPYPMRICIEDTASGPTAIKYLKDKLPGVFPISAAAGIWAKANVALIPVSAGDVLLPSISDPSEWNDTPVAQRTKAMFDNILLSPFIKNMIVNFQRYPNVTHDDDIAAFSQLVCYIGDIPTMDFGYISRIKKSQSTSERRATTRINRIFAC